mgnify:CR=1 FL=1
MSLKQKRELTCQDCRNAFETQSSTRDHLGRCPSCREKFRETLQISGLAKNASVKVVVEEHLPEERDTASVKLTQTFLAPTQYTKDLVKKVRIIAATEYPVLIVGETGTGKELIASLLHQYSSRCDQPLLLENCAAFTGDLASSHLFGHVHGAFTGATGNRDGLFVAAHKGLLFLDELESLPYTVQAKLLRTIQFGEVSPIGSSKNLRVDVRVVFATNNTNLKELLRKGELRSDLYHRLTIKMYLKPLRERLEEIPLLVSHNLRIISRRISKEINGIDEQARKLLLEYHWPGNIRELENVLIEGSLVAENAILKATDLPRYVHDTHHKPELVASSALARTGSDHM